MLIFSSAGTKRSGSSNEPMSVDRGRADQPHRKMIRQERTSGARGPTPSFSNDTSSGKGEGASSLDDTRIPRKGAPQIEGSHKAGLPRGTPFTLDASASQSF